MPGASRSANIIWHMKVIINKKGLVITTYDETALRETKKCVTAWMAENDIGKTGFESAMPLNKLLDELELKVITVEARTIADDAISAEELQSRLSGLQFQARLIQFELDRRARLMKSKRIAS